MAGFGFSLLKDRQIDYDNNDHRLFRFVEEQEPSIRLCIGCGGCTAGCTAAGFTGFNYRKLNYLLMRGETENLQKGIQQCMLCGKCKLVCPRGVNTRNMIFALKRAFTTPLWTELKKSSNV